MGFLIDHLNRKSWEAIEGDCSNTVGGPPSKPRRERVEGFDCSAIEIIDIEVTPQELTTVGGFEEMNPFVARR